MMQRDSALESICTWMKFGDYSQGPVVFRLIVLTGDSHSEYTTSGALLNVNVNGKFNV